MRQLLVSAGLLLPLALDTFALAAALGLAGLDPRQRLRVSLVFTLFEVAMPVIGVLIGHAAGHLLGQWADYAAIAVLTLAGLVLLWPSRDEEREERNLRLLASAQGLAVVGLGLSVSLDELTIGLSAGLLGLPLAMIVVWITVQAFVAAQLGVRLGGRLSEQFRERSEQIAGLALIALAAGLLVLRLTGV